MKSLASAGLAGLALVLLIVAGSCHPLNNPVDPRSSAYTGEPVLRDPPDPPLLLPRTVRWESVAEHFPDQRLALEITADGAFVEPRRPDSPAELWIVVTFEEPVDPEELERGMVAARVNDGFGTNTTIIGPGGSGGYGLSQDRLRLRIPVRAPLPPFRPYPNAASVRMRIVDANGSVAGERLFGILPGDFTGDGVVDIAEDLWNGADMYDGHLASQDNLRTTRADMNADGVVETGWSEPDALIVENNGGTSLPPLPPRF